jgi:hypothetical protein
VAALISWFGTTAHVAAALPPSHKPQPVVGIANCGSHQGPRPTPDSVTKGLGGCFHPLIVHLAALTCTRQVRFPIAAGPASVAARNEPDADDLEQWSRLSVRQGTRGSHTGGVDLLVE